MRADAEQNRQKIITAAHALFSERGIDIPLREVTEKAGVGIGTLYRHFPNREKLLEGVVEHVAATLLNLCLDTQEQWAEDPAVSWQNFIAQIFELQPIVLLVQMHDTAKLPESPQGLEKLIVGHRKEIYAEVEKILDLARKDKLVRQDITFEEFQAIAMVCTHPVPIKIPILESEPQLLQQFLLNGLR